MKKLILVALLLLAAPQITTAAIKVNDAAPIFSLPERGNKQFSLVDFVGANRNKSGLIISFFASWCLQCREELPILNRAADDLKGKGITIVLVGVRESFSTIESLLANLKVDKPVVVSDRDGVVSELYQVRFLPVTFFVGSDGKVKDVIYGGISDEAHLRKSASKMVP